MDLDNYPVKVVRLPPYNVFLTLPHSLVELCHIKILGGLVDRDPSLLLRAVGGELCQNLNVIHHSATVSRVDLYHETRAHIFNRRDRAVPVVFTVLCALYLA